MDVNPDCLCGWNVSVTVVDIQSELEFNGVSVYFCIMGVNVSANV